MYTKNERIEHFSAQKMNEPGMGIFIFREKEEANPPTGERMAWKKNKKKQARIFFS